MNPVESWGRLYSIDGEYLRHATEREWVESCFLDTLWAKMGYIPITMVSCSGENTTIQACVIGGPGRCNDI